MLATCGNTKQVKGGNSFFTDRREFVVKPGGSGLIYFGLLGGTYNGSGQLEHYCNLRIYNAWIE